MKEEILTKLNEIQDENNIKILYSCESGSRAWGFASKDSDYDVRFIYIHALDWYLSIKEQKDSIELPIDKDLLDLGGWELRKTLRLISKSNATPFEWMQSPIIYLEEQNFKDNLWNAGKDFFNPKAMIYHYLGIAKKSLLSGIDDGTIKIKKYFYVLRPLLAAMWIVEKNEIPPMEFSKLLKLIHENSGIQQIIHELWDKKKSSDEGYKIELIPELQSFILENMGMCKTASDNLTVSKMDTSGLNVFFQGIIGV
jgi:predicted nucleotidyltransferase